MLENIYNAIIKKYWDFRVNDGKARKDRMKQVVFFKKHAYNINPIFDYGDCRQQ